MHNRFWRMTNKAAGNEAASIDFYRKMASMAPNSAIHQSLQRILEDEESHRDYFESLLTGSPGQKERGQKDDDLRDIKHERYQTRVGRIRIPEVSKPYPPIKVKGKNPEYARLLLDDYAGMAGELTAVTQYIYHHHDMPKEFAEAAELLEGVAVVEMRHMEILAELINLLGLPPMYMDGQGRYWDAAYVPYMMGNPCQQLRVDIESEKAAIRSYKEHMAMIEDKYVKAMLARIIQDEELHLRLFNRVYKRLCRC